MYGLVLNVKKYNRLHLILAGKIGVGAELAEVERHINLTRDAKWCRFLQINSRERSGVNFDYQCQEIQLITQIQMLIIYVGKERLTIYSLIGNVCSGKPNNFSESVKL